MSLSPLIMWTRKRPTGREYPTNTRGTDSVITLGLKTIMFEIFIKLSDCAQHDADRETESHL